MDFIQTILKFFTLNSRPLLVPIITGVVFLLPIITAPKIVEANPGGIVFDPTNLVENAASAVAGELMAAATDGLSIKEYVLDPLLWALVNTFLEQMTEDIVTWINSGFQGNPAFVSDFGGFMNDVADITAGELIWQNEDLNFLCSPFNLNVRLALDAQYAASRAFRPECTLTEVVGNIENAELFLGGDFSAGGWDAWKAMTMDPNNNPYGTLVKAQGELNARIGNKTLIEGKMLDWGKGMFSQRVCDLVNPETGETYCNVVTPGTVIEDSLNKTLGSGQRRLEVADEISEILGALMGQLVQSMFNSAEGLLGLSQGGGGRPSYFASAPRTTGSSPDLVTNVTRSLTTEQTFLAQQGRLLALIQDAQTYRSRTYPITPDDPLDPFDEPQDSCENPSAVPPFPPALAAGVTQIGTNIASANTAITELSRIQTGLANETDPDILSQLANDFLTLRTNGSLRSEIDVRTFELRELQGAAQAIADYQTAVDQACREFVSTGGA
jgi:hypothetical protein